MLNNCFPIGFFGVFEMSSRKGEESLTHITKPICIFFLLSDFVYIITIAVLTVNFIIRSIGVC